jgi:tetratricopeptide (TPR) repeat protein
MSEREILDSWKEIAAFLKRNKRTCQRWEREFALPVHRLEESSKARVFAYKEELERWMEEKARGPGRGFLSRKWRKPLVGAALIIIPGVVLYELNRRAIPPPPMRIAVMYAVNNSADRSLSDEFRWVIPYYLGMDLAQSKYLTVLPQDCLMQIMSDMKKLDEERHLSKTLDSISEKTNVKYFVLPSFTKVGKDLCISFTVREAGNDATLGGPDMVKGSKPENFLSMVDELSLKVKSGLNLSPAEIASDSDQDVGKITTASLEAVRDYIEAEKYHVQWDFKTSVQFLDKAVREDPDYAMAYKLMAENYDYLGELDKNSLYIRKALALVDHVSEKDRLIIQEYAATIFDESPLQAMKFSKKLIALDPKDQDSYIKLGAVWRDLEEWDFALAQFEKTLTINPENAIALENKAYIYGAMGRYREAIKTCETSARVSPKNAYFLRYLPLLYLVQGQYDRASAELEKALANAPDNLHFLALEGHLHYLRGDLASARRFYEQVQHRGEATPNAPDLRGRLWLAYLDLLQGKYRQARKGILVGIELAKIANRAYDELNYRLLLAYSELQLRQFLQASEALKPALELSQKAVVTDSQKLALHLLGLASLGAGQIEDATRTGQQLHQLIGRKRCPKHLRYYDHLMGQIALAEGHFEQAINYFGQAMKLLPYQSETNADDAFFYDGLASAYYQRGDWPKAIETYSRIIALTTGRLRWGDIYAQSYYRLGKIYQRTGNSAEAKAHSQSFLKLWENADDGLPEVADARKQLEALGNPP